MLYYLFRYLGEFGVSGANLWHYISFRAVLTLVLSLLISMWFGQYFVKWMKAHHGSEAQRDASIDPYGVDKVLYLMVNRQVQLSIYRFVGHDRCISHVIAMKKWPVFIFFKHFLW